MTLESDDRADAFSVMGRLRGELAGHALAWARADLAADRVADEIADAERRLRAEPDRDREAVRIAAAHRDDASDRLAAACRLADERHASMTDSAHRIREHVDAVARSARALRNFVTIPEPDADLAGPGCLVDDLSKRLTDAEAHGLASVVMLSKLSEPEMCELLNAITRCARSK